MRNCQSCGETLGAGARFCTGCGTPAGDAARACTSCSEQIGPDAAFCPACGTAVTAVPPADAPDAMSGATLAALRAAAGKCREALGRFLNGAIDEEELARRLFEEGIVRTEQAVWFLDVRRGRWCRFDGLGVWLSDEESAGAPAGEPG